MRAPWRVAVGASAALWLCAAMPPEVAMPEDVAERAPDVSQAASRDAARDAARDALRARDIVLDLEGLSGWAEAFASDGRMIRAGESVVQGVDAIRELLAGWRASYVAIKWSPRSVEVAASGDLGFTRGVLTRTRPATDGYESWSGTYVRVWRRGEDGEWKISVDIANLQPGLGR